LCPSNGDTDSPFNGATSFKAKAKILEVGCVLLCIALVCPRLISLFQ
jgi:hypothetical protein